MAKILKIGSKIILSLLDITSPKFLKLLVKVAPLKHDQIIKASKTKMT
jgi:hypothetical protein